MAAVTACHISFTKLKPTGHAVEQNQNKTKHNQIYHLYEREIRNVKEIFVYLGSDVGSTVGKMAETTRYFLTKNLFSYHCPLNSGNGVKCMGILVIQYAK